MLAGLRQKRRLASFWQEMRMSSMTQAPPLKHAAAPTIEESILVRFRALILGPRGVVLERGDEELHRALERAFAEFACEMRG